MTKNTAQFFQRPNKPDLAYLATKGDEFLPTIVFLGGFKSDMQGSKATYLEATCAERNQSYVRFDYSGHGQSEGEFVDGCISEWAQDADDIIKNCTSGDVILVGSSMGGWISLLCARDNPERLKAFVGIAAAPDFTTWMEAQMNDAQRQTIKEQGYFEEPSDYDEPYIITGKLLKDGRDNIVLESALKVDCSVRLLQGKKDTDVPWKTAEQIQAALTSQDVEIIYRDEGNHSLSTPEDLAILDEILISLSR